MHLSGPSLVLVATGIVGSTWLSGAIISFSIGGAPAAAAMKQSSAKIWAELYKRGAASMPKFAIGTSLAYLFAAYDSYRSEGSWGSYLGAAGCVLSIIPFTLTIMKDVNGQLHEEALKEDSGEAQVTTIQVEGLLDRWITLNLIRGLLPLAGTALGCFAFHRDGF
ncbi:uncharacterized protein TRIVIDRAFT_216078 [Trichoderma virens Gv29-8]|uniref:Uncharacterized protein n=1 Tax=Hypocrea virens (strain Gv29-8 / FGSC 10586) TaxID=413071 RepID=G9MRB4_HYPVG|nr:uncharacterized protein TRIVIDRAFT_216078 [Trichoderma virens Gv29-8]EHK22638.1 hypothetical protein TRIVIDRAFT_216078 [Trichoderma virens Gv29-8]UKZ47690.1 hypothetical protein TrVGV298_001916 [Trichoderma virens]